MMISPTTHLGDIGGYGKCCLAVSSAPERGGKYVFWITGRCLEDLLDFKDEIIPNAVLYYGRLLYFDDDALYAVIALMMS